MLGLGIVFIFIFSFISASFIFCCRSFGLVAYDI